MSDTHKHTHQIKKEKRVYCPPPPSGEWRRAWTTYIVNILIDGQTGQIRRSIRKSPKDARRRQKLDRAGRDLAHERQALEVPTNIAQGARGGELLLNGIEANVEAERDRLRLLLAAVEAREDVRRDAEVGAAEERRVARRSEPHRLSVVPEASVLERGELRLRREPLRERLVPLEDAREALEFERAILQYPHVDVLHRPGLARLGEVDGLGDGQVLEVHEQLHHLRHDVFVALLGLSMHRLRERQGLDAASQIRSCDHRPTEKQESPLGDGDVFVKLGLDVDPERMGDQAEAIVELGGMDELQYGSEKFGW